MAHLGFKAFFQELRRRKVFSVVALYAAAAWVVIEVGGEAIDAGLISALTTRDLFILALIGFPLTLVAGWFYDITKHGIVRTAPATADDAFDDSLHMRDYLLMAVMVAMWAGAYVFVHTPPPVDKSIAILPFENRGNDPENAHFAFGIHDDLMTQLGRVGDLTLIAQSSVSQVDSETPVELVGSKLGVAYVMKGSVERILDRIRVNVVLVEAAEARQAWSGSYDRELSTENLFDIRDEIASAITGQLQAMLSPEESSRVFGGMPTENLAAYQLYMRGRQLFAKRTREDLEQALVLYRRALELDPEFALAWVGIVDATGVLANGLYIDGDKALADMREAVDNALALDDGLGEAYTSLAWVYRWEDQPEKAADACRKFMELSPNYAQGHHWCMRVWLGEDAGYEDRLAAFYRIAQMDPLSTLTQLNIAITLTDNRNRFDEAREQFEHVLQMDPEFFQAYRWFGILETETGNLAHAVALTRRANQLNPGYIYGQVNLFMAFLAMEEFDHAVEVSEALLAIDNPIIKGGYEKWALLFDLVLNVARGDWREAVRLFETANLQIGNFTSLPGWYAWALIIGGDFEKARKPWFDGTPDHIDPVDEDQVTRSEIGCVTAGLLMTTGDGKRGKELLAQTKHYFEETLRPDDPNRARTWVCYLVEGRHQDALDEYEKWAERGYISMWWRDRQLPWWDQVRDSARFQALEERVNDMIAEQRELLRQMESEL